MGSVGLITPDALVPSAVAALSEAGVSHAVLGQTPEPGAVEFDEPLDVVPASLAKGLEFDHVVLVEPAAIVAGEADRVTGLRRLYVCLTRAVTSLAVLHAEPLPDRARPARLGVVSDLDRFWPSHLPTSLRVRLETAYDDPGRGYHDLLHLTEVLHHVEDLLDADDPARDTVLLAAWFHDAVYDGQRDDEERSAVLAESALGGPLGAEVARLVRVTADHRPAASDVAGQVLCDADLAILAAEPARYASYTAGVRREYAHVSDRDFASGRAAVLRDLLAQPTLFHTAAARRWEARARANVEAELARLTG